MRGSVRFGIGRELLNFWDDLPDWLQFVIVGVALVLGALVIIGRAPMPQVWK